MPLLVGWLGALETINLTFSLNCFFRKRTKKSVFWRCHDTFVTVKNGEITAVLSESARHRRRKIARLLIFKTTSRFYGEEESAMCHAARRCCFVITVTKISAVFSPRLLLVVR